jgi:methionyl aminopeptidase
MYETTTPTINFRIYRNVLFFLGFKEAWATHKQLHVTAIANRKAEVAASVRVEAIKFALFLYMFLIFSFSKTNDPFKGFKFSGPLRPGFVSAQMTVPANIVKTEYAEDGIPKSELTMRGSSKLEVLSAADLVIMRPVAKLAGEILLMCGAMVQPGVTPDQIDRAVFAAAIAHGCYPSPLNYREFPKSVCTSVNEVICHGIPDDRPFADGDIVNCDVTMFRDGFHGDCNATFFAGKVDSESARLVEAARNATAEAIKIVRAGTMFRDIGKAIAKVIDKTGFSIVKSYCGHGVGRLFHGPPNVPHYPRNKAIGAMRPGHCITIEPMINAGSWHDMLWPDEWTSTTVDGQRSAQFEHSMVVTANGVEVLTTAGLSTDIVMHPPAYARDHSGNQRFPCPPHLAQFARAVGVNVFVEGEEAATAATTSTTAAAATPEVKMADAAAATQAIAQ